MISCPSDVTESEDALKIINEWNSKYTKDFNICFVPQFWQINTTSNINGERPQEILNKSLVYNSDCIVVIFWGKFGSDTGKEASGTLEELKTSFELKKKIGLFFCEKPINPSLLNPKDLIEIKSVKENFGKLGVYQTYSHEFDFRAKFNHFLHELANEIEQKTSEESPHTNSNKEHEEEVSSQLEINQTTVQDAQGNLPGVLVTNPDSTKIKALLLNIEPRQNKSEFPVYENDYKNLCKITDIISKDEILLQTLKTHQIPNNFSKKAFEQLLLLLDLKNEADFFFYDSRSEQTKKNFIHFATRIQNFLKLYYQDAGEFLVPSPALQKQITNETINVIHDYDRAAKYFLTTLRKLIALVKEPVK